MFKAYRYVKTVCGICKKRQECYNGRRIERNEAIDYGTLRVMATAITGILKIRRRKVTNERSKSANAAVRYPG